MTPDRAALAMALQLANLLEWREGFDNYRVACWLRNQVMKELDRAPVTREK